MALLHEAAMLVTLKTKVWGARKIDTAVTDDILNSKQASSRAGGFSKSLMPDNPELKQIRKLVGKLRNEHYKLSAPWGKIGETGAGIRIITTKIHQDHTQLVEDAKNEFQPLVDSFKSNFKVHLKHAQKKLGKLYDANDYTDLDLDKEFSIEVEYSPVPNPANVDDFRLSMPADTIAKIKAEVAQRNLAVVGNIQQSLYKRLEEKVRHVHETLSKNPNGGGYHKTLTTNVKEIADIVQKLNVDDDEILDKLASKAAKEIGSVSVSDIKKNPKLAEEIKEKAGQQAADINKRLNGLAGD